MTVQRHDWPAIIKAIIAAYERDRPGRSGLHTLAKLMHREHIQIQRWMYGSEPRHYEGEMLLEIYRSISSEAVRACG